MWRLLNQGRTRDFLFMGEGRQAAQERPQNFLGVNAPLSPEAKKTVKI